MRIFGMTYATVGDLIMGLPYLTYFEKKYPGSYKIWTVYKKVDFCAPLFYNHPLIDRIHISEEYNALGPKDHALMETCDIVILPSRRPSRINRRAYNRVSIRDLKILNTPEIDLEDMKRVLDPEDWFPKLEKWFTPGFETTKNSWDGTAPQQPDHSNIISIFPGAGGDRKGLRCPSKQWWGNLIDELSKEGYKVFHFGHPLEEKITDNPNYTQHTSLPFISQIKLCLSTKLVIGTDSGSMWVVGAYEHPSIQLMSNWLRGHNENPLALAPVNRNAVNIFEPGGAENIKIKNVLKQLGDMI